MRPLPLPVSCVVHSPNSSLPGVLCRRIPATPILRCRYRLRAAMDWGSKRHRQKQAAAAVAKMEPEELRSVLGEASGGTACLFVGEGEASGDAVRPGGWRGAGAEPRVKLGCEAGCRVGVLLRICGPCRSCQIFRIAKECTGLISMAIIGYSPSHRSDQPGDRQGKTPRVEYGCAGGHAGVGQPPGLPEGGLAQRSVG